MVIAAHPDDEVLGCGAAVIAHTMRGDEARAVIACEGESLRYKEKSVNMKSCSENAAGLLGYSREYYLNFPDQRLDTLSLIEIIGPLEKIISEYKPQLIYCQSGCDINRDHKILFESALVALRPKLSFVEEILAFYTMGSSEWNSPNTFIPDTWIIFGDEIMQRKLKAFSCYTSEVCEYPHPRSMKGLKNIAEFFGNQVCSEYAEAFVTIRRRINLN